MNFLIFLFIETSVKKLQETKIFVKIKNKRFGIAENEKDDS